MSDRITHSEALASGIRAGLVVVPCAVVEVPLSRWRGAAQRFALVGEDGAALAYELPPESRVHGHCEYTYVIAFGDLRTTDGQALIGVSDEGGPVVLMSRRLVERDGHTTPEQDEPATYSWEPCRGWTTVGELRDWITGRRRAERDGEDGELDDDPAFHAALRLVF